MTRSPRILWPVAVLLVIHAVAVAAPWLSPYEPTSQHRESPFAPPSRWGFEDGGLVVWSAETAHPLRFFALSGDGPMETRRRLVSVEPPGRFFLLGTDRFGRDQLSRWLHGARISLSAGLLAGLLAVGLGWILGGVAGYSGGRLDSWIMRSSELFLVLPWLYVLLAVRAFLPLDLGPSEAFFIIVLILGAVGWVKPARMIRGVVASAVRGDAVLAARGFGAGPLHLLRRHLLPAASGVAATQLALRIPQYILAEVTLSFLGLGMPEPTPSWGNLLAELQRYHVLVSYPWMAWPVVMLLVIVLSYHLLVSTLQSRPS